MHPRLLIQTGAFLCRCGEKCTCLLQCGPLSIDTLFVLYYIRVFSLRPFLQKKAGKPPEHSRIALSQIIMYNKTVYK